MEWCKNQENTNTQENNKENNQQENTEVKNSTTTVNISGYQKIVQKGFGEVIEDENTANYVGLHKDAPVGTIVSVKK